MRYAAPSRMDLRRGSGGLKVTARSVRETAHDVRRTTPALLVAGDTPVRGGCTSVAVSPRTRRCVALAGWACLGLGDRGRRPRPTGLAPIKVYPAAGQRGGSPRARRFGRALTWLESR